jgi:hypothetical protein
MDETKLDEVIEGAIQDPKTKEVEQRSTHLTTLAKNYQTISSVDEKDGAVVFLKEIKSAYNEAEKRRKFLVDPLNAHVKTINAEIKKFTEPLLTLEKNIKTAISDFVDAQERARQAEQNRLLLAAQKEQEEINKLAEAEGVEAPIINVPMLNEVETHTDGATVKKVWTFEVADPAQIPREYLSPDLVAIGAAVKAGAREIPGVRVYQKSQVSVRL